MRPLSVRTPFDGPAAPRLPVERLGVPLRLGALARVDPARHEVLTTDGAVIGYDRLVVAVGARAKQALDGALHFHGPRSAGLLENALRHARPEPGRPIAFVVPPGLTWPLPLYELVLAAAAEADRELCLITPEVRPLELFGPHASDAVARLLDRAQVEVGSTDDRPRRVRRRAAARAGRADGSGRGDHAPHAGGPPHRRASQRPQRLPARRRVRAGPRRARRVRRGRRDRRDGQAGRPRRPAGRRGRRRDHRLPAPGRAGAAGDADDRPASAVPAHAARPPAGGNRLERATVAAGGQGRRPSPRGLFGGRAGATAGGPAAHVSIA